ncbi:MAG: maleylpyruvate isomerase family mycothiol-dependent enzyme [Burkholderiaceae bacterium]
MSLPQAFDFRDESRALHQLLAAQPESFFSRESLFKGWSANDVLQHLAYWNDMAGRQLTDVEGLVAVLGVIRKHPRGLRGHESDHFAGLTGTALLEHWRKGFEAVAELFSQADPKQRLKWSGPDMSARSSMTARLMETWAHGQALYDLLGVVRQDQDRLQNIVVLGINTYGSRWTFGDPGSIELSGRIEGPATAFCQVVTQTRHFTDVDLRIEGAHATAWMSQAQCFAGPPHDPPAPGTRFTQNRSAQESSTGAST